VREGRGFGYLFAVLQQRAVEVDARDNQIVVAGDRACELRQIRGTRTAHNAAPVVLGDPLSQSQSEPSRKAEIEKIRNQKSEIRNQK
jgi:hypothetical protein